MFRMLLVSCATLVGATAATADRFPTGAWSFDPDRIFPDGLFAPADRLRDAKERRHHAAVMRALREPALHRSEDGTTLMRLTVFPDGGTPFAFRVTRQDTAFVLHFKKTWGPANDPGGLRSHDRFDMDAADFLDALEAMGQIAVCAPANPPGSSRPEVLWIVETRNGPYCARTFATPVGPGFNQLISALSAALRGVPALVRSEQDRTRRTVD